MSYENPEGMHDGGPNYTVLDGEDLIGGLAEELAPEFAIPAMALGGLVGGDSVLVHFTCHGGGYRIYRYSGAAAEAIRGGANPSNFPGELVEQTD